MYFVISELETGAFLDVNEKFVEMTGFSREEALGKTSVELGLTSAENCKAEVSGQVGFAFRSGEMNAYIVFSKKHPLGEYASEMFDQGYMIIMGNGSMERITSKLVPANN